MGSCFGEEMHRRILAKGHASFVNPFGVIFHPKALHNNCALIAHAADRSAFESALRTTDFYEHQGIFHSLQHANRFQNTQPAQLLEEIYTIAQQAYINIKQAQLIGITLGTAWIYEHLPTQQFVGNCHKLPQQEFRKTLSLHAQIKNDVAGLLNALRQINDHAHLVITVSPVRHLRDGVQENLASKSTLISALGELLMEQQAKVHYFPAYEIIREELNDWQFFEADKMHPTEEAIEVVFDRFYRAFFSTNDSTFSAVL
ncbi:MAG: GSCFA domain-containing protein [Bacteroidota bacterium]